MAKRESHFLTATLFALALVTVICTLVFRPTSEDPGYDENIQATIISVKKVRDQSFHRGSARIMVELIAKRTDGKLITAYGLADQLSNCSAGDDVFVRVNNLVVSTDSVYRLVSESCS